MKFNNFKKVLGIFLCSASIVGTIGVESMAMTKEELVAVRNSFYDDGSMELSEKVVDLLISSYRRNFKEVEDDRFYDAMAGLIEFMNEYFKCGKIDLPLRNLNLDLETLGFHDIFIQKRDIAECFLHYVLIDRFSCEDAREAVLRNISDKNLDVFVNKCHNEILSYYVSLSREIGNLGTK